MGKHGALNELYFYQYIPLLIFYKYSYEMMHNEDKLKTRKLLLLSLHFYRQLLKVHCKHLKQ